ncbi:MAG: TetR/AcrR family transcriptional regulator [Opitutales bacterium]|nr:TetR/AcrR family transcriptional regulator [Opitutales bacterium]
MNSKKRRPGRPRDEELVTRRKEEILAEATRLFAEFGYRQADVQVLADRLGIGKGTVYRYFPTKENLFFAAVDAGIRALVDRVSASSKDTTDPVHRLRKNIHAYLSFFDEQPDVVELLIIERAEFRDREKATYFLYKDRYRDERINQLMDAMQQGVFRQMPPERVMNVIGDCLYGVIFTNHFANRKIPFDEQAEDVIDIILHGLLPN